MKQWAGRIVLVLVCAGAGFGGKLIYDVTQHLLEDHRNHHAVLDWANRIVEAEKARQAQQGNINVSNPADAKTTSAPVGTSK